MPQILKTANNKRKRKKENTAYHLKTKNYRGTHETPEIYIFKA